MNDRARGFRSRRALSALTIAVATLSLGACDGGPGFSKWIQVENRCASAVLVLARNNAEDPGYQWTVNDMTGIGEGEAHRFVVADLTAPEGDFIYVWVVSPDATTVGEPTKLYVPDLELLSDPTATSATEERRVVLEGDLCP